MTDQIAHIVCHFPGIAISSHYFFAVRYFQVLQN